MSDFLTFQEFDTYEDAVELGNKLEELGIPTQIEQNKPLLDQNFIGKQYNNYILLKIPGEYFERAHKMLIETTKVNLADVDKNYMLFSLSTKELMDVLAKPDEWGAYNYNVALAILKQRGESPDEQKTETLQQENIFKLYKRRKLPDHWLVFGYGFSLIGVIASAMNAWTTLLILYQFYLLPGILGIILGLIINRTKKTLPNGEHIYAYDDKARKHGFYMLWLGILSLMFIIAKGLMLRNQTF